MIPRAFALVNHGMSSAPDIVACPRCQQRLRKPPDLGGRALRCPSCQQVFTPAAPPAPPAPPPEPVIPLREEWIVEPNKPPAAPAPPPGPTQIPCPQCRRPLLVPANLWRTRLKCPSCPATFVPAEVSAGPAHSGGPAPEPKETAPSRDRGPVRRPRTEDEGDEEDFKRPLRPDRGGLVLVLGILSIVLSCAPLIGLSLGLAAWRVGSDDLRQMAYGRVDKSGKKTVTIGKTCGLIGTVLSALFFAVACLLALSSHK